MWPFDRPARPSADPTLPADVMVRVEHLAATVSRIETEWEDTKDQVRKSYKRIERANQRAAERDRPHQDPADSPLKIVQATDPYSRKLAQVREQVSDAV